MRNYRTVSSPDSWTYIYPKNIYQGLDADKPSLADSFEGYAQGLGCRISDQTLWGVVSSFYRLQKFNTSGEVLDFWNLYGGSNGAEIDGDNDDWLWVSTRFDAIAKYSISKRTDQAEITYFSMGTVDGYNSAVNGICAPSGEFIYYGIDGGVRKARKADGVIIADYPLSNNPSDLAWDGANIWVAYAEVPAIDCFNPNDFSLVKTINSPYPNNQGLTWDGNNLWVSYPAGNDGNGIITKLGASSGNPASIYYATDTKKFYWNVGNAWEEVPKGAENFLAFPDSPDSYGGQGGKMIVVNSTEDGLEFIDNSSTSIAKSGSAAMSGDILFEAGDNVTITQDDAAKKIIISAVAVEPPPPAATVSSISGMTGDILFEAGANVTLTEDAAAKKIIIAAAALESTGDANSLNGIPVNTDTLADGYVLTYDALSGKILLKPKPSGGGGDGHLIGIQALMNISSKALTNAQYGIQALMNVASSTVLKP